MCTKPNVSDCLTSLLTPVSGFICTIESISCETIVNMAVNNCTVENRTAIKQTWSINRPNYITTITTSLHSLDYFTITTLTTLINNHYITTSLHHYNHYTHGINKQSLHHYNHYTQYITLKSLHHSTITTSLQALHSLHHSTSLHHCNHYNHYITTTVAHLITQLIKFMASSCWKMWHWAHRDL